MTHLSDLELVEHILQDLVILDHASVLASKLTLRIGTAPGCAASISWHATAPDTACRPWNRRMVLGLKTRTLGESRREWVARVAVWERKRRRKGVAPGASGEREQGGREVGWAMKVWFKDHGPLDLGGQEEGEVRADLVRSFQMYTNFWCSFFRCIYNRLWLQRSL